MSVSRRGTLFGVLKDESKILDWPTALDYAIGMTKGIVTLHNWEPPIYHRDLKSMNLLVTSTGAIKVTDFGTSHFDTDGNDVSRMQEVGTIAYVCAYWYFWTAEAILISLL
jgi:serine/threonine protein kinase